MNVTVKASKDTTIPLPAWYGNAAWLIHVLADDPSAADGLPVLDMDAVHAKNERREIDRLRINLGRALDWIDTAGREVRSSTTVDAFLRTFPGEQTSC